MLDQIKENEIYRMLHNAHYKSVISNENITAPGSHGMPMVSPLVRVKDKLFLLWGARLNREGKYDIDKIEVCPDNIIKCELNSIDFFHDKSLEIPDGSALPKEIQNVIDAWKKEINEH